MKKFFITYTFFLLFSLWTNDIFSQIPDTLTADTLATDSLVATTDTLDSDSLKTSENSDFKAPVFYKAQDSIVFFLEDKTTLFYNNVEVKYEDIDLKSGKVKINWNTKIIEAQGIKDSTDTLRQTPVFKDKKDVYYAEKIKYNFETKKGIIIYARTQQGEDVIYGDTVKRNPDKTFFIKDGVFTTCDAQPPHFYIKSSKLKIVPGKKVISGPLLMYVGGIPLPVILPFGYFPQSQGRTSGIVFPTFGESAQRGFFARQFGYYWGASDYFDAFFNADLFTLGGWRFGVISNYKKRYALQGRIQLDYSLQKYNEKFDPDYQEQKTFFIRWNHNHTLTPNDKIQANVNAGSSTFLQFNSYQTTDYLRTQLQSSVTYQKRFVRSPWNLTAGATHSQQLQTRDITISFPNIFLARARWFPFKSQKSLKKRWYEKVGIAYSTNFTNKLSVKDSNLFLPTIGDSLQYGLKQNTTTSMNLKILNYFTLSPSLNFAEIWYPWEIEKSYVLRDSSYVLENRRIYRFTPVRDFRGNVNLATQVYGIFQRSRKWAFRHTLNPVLGYSYKPDFSDPTWKVYKKVVHPLTSDTLIYSKVEGGVFGGPAAGEISALNLALNNRYEVKFLKSEYAKGDSALPTNPKDAYKYITLLDNLGIFASYNFAADSMNLSEIRFNARNYILNTFNTNINLSLNPYALDSSGRVINEFYWNTDKKLGRWTNINITLGASLRNLHEFFLASDTEKQTQKSDYEEFAWKWDLNFNYMFTYSRPAFEIRRTQSLRFGGNFSPTPSWRLSFNSGYDFNTKKLSFTTLTLHRDLHCWEMNITVIPFGIRKSYFLTLQVKASSLRDLKITKRRDWQDRVSF